MHGAGDIGTNDNGTALSTDEQKEDLPSAVVWRFSYVPHRGCELWCVGEYPFGAGAHGENRTGGEGQEGGMKGKEKPERWGGVLREEYVRWRLERGL